ncbi:flavohemoglobin expression-modulating QEGLA motif protein [Formosa haliotis]|uniref:flavohemoglobin expression-modulating QEGLA motif protein n=1 Tax=Formosa haliotis TaxID=1555194 RepID=UPI000824E4C0|nr:tyrosine/phenylalanine carboxypeptidase domain-containing protein [Formosa haliotis]
MVALDSDIIESICASLSKNQPVNEHLPNKGLLHIDKLMPFICVYRYKEIDVYFSRLIKTQASYLIVDETINVSHLLDAINLLISQKFEMFLVLEMWPNVEDQSNQFNVFCPEDKAPGAVKALYTGFNKLKATHPNLTTEVIDTLDRHPDHLQPLLDSNASKKSGTLIIGLEIPTLYKNSKSNELYSLFFREFYAVFSETIKRSVYEFIRVQTSDDFKNYLMLGKTHIDEITLQTDKELADISERMAFLLRVTPVNSNEEWDRFKEQDFEKEPAFKYRLIALDPEVEKRKLYNIPIDKIEDPTLAFIFRGKRLEIEKQLIMLEERGSKNFRYVGESLYGGIASPVLKEAKHILETFPEPEIVNHAKRLDCYEFADVAQTELDYYNGIFPNADIGLEIRNDVAGIMVSKSKLLINDQLLVDEKRVDALIHHEIGTHILTYCNGKNQPIKQMYEGFEGYDQLQEGLAVIAEYLVGGLTVNRLRLLAGRVMAVESMLKGANFITTFNILRIKYSFSAYSAYTITMRVYRGGGLTKDAIYLAGIMDLMNYLKQGGKIDYLYTGKFNITHTHIIEELLYRNVLNPAEIPRFYQRESVIKRLNHLYEGIEIKELVN